MRCLSIALIAAVYSVGSTASAFAADIPTKAPVAPVAATYNWTGFYIGANIGYGWGLNDPTYSFVGFQNTFLRAALNDQRTDHVNGVLGGLQLGYNWQAGNIVYGIETDFQASGQEGTTTFQSGIAVPLAGGSNPTSISNTTKIDWFGTTRGRIGFASGRWLAYATGGVAYGRVKTNGVASPVTIVIANTPFAWSSSDTKLGWTVGGGVEAALVGNWSWKAEYLYVDLGSIAASTNLGAQCFGVPGGGCVIITSGSGTITGKITDNIVRLGLNYRLAAY